MHPRSPGPKPGALSAKLPRNKHGQNTNEGKDRKSNDMFGNGRLLNDRFLHAAYQNRTVYFRPRVKEDYPGHPHWPQSRLAYRRKLSTRIGYSDYINHGLKRPFGMREVGCVAGNPGERVT